MAIKYPVKYGKYLLLYSEIKFMLQMMFPINKMIFELFKSARSAKQVCRLYSNLKHPYIPIENVCRICIDNRFLASAFIISLGSSLSQASSRERGHKFPDFVIC